MAVTRPTDSLQSKKGCRRRALRRGDCPAGAGHSRGPPATMPTSSHALPVGDARTTMHPWVSKPGTPKSKPETPKSKPAATKSKSGATKSKCLLLPRMEVSQWVEYRFRPAGGRCDSTGQATSPSGPFARVVSEKLNHRWGDLARKCRFEVFPRSDRCRNKPRTPSTDPAEERRAGRCRALREEPKTILLQTVAIAALGLLARPPALEPTASRVAWRLERRVRRGWGRHSFGAVQIASRSLSLNRWILPVAVLGNSAMNSMARGYL